MSHPFDVRTLLARHLHARACGQPHAFPPEDCLLALAAARDMRDDLLASGLALVPVSTIGFLERALEEADGDGSREPAPELPHGPTHELYHAQVRIRMRMSDGRVEYGPLLPRWAAEIDLVALNGRHGSDVVAARIEAESPWVQRLLHDLPPLS